MVDVLLNTDDIVVFGPPETLDVQVDIGPKGTRGSQVFVGVGDPNIVEIGQTPLLNDLFINTSPGEERGYMYQYQAQPGGDTWVQILDLNPAIYSINYEAVFDAGEGSVTIPIADITSATGLTADNFNVQFSFSHTNPVAASLSLLSVVSSNLVADFKAVESDSGTWQDLDSTVTMHLTISVVDATSES